MSRAIVLTGSPLGEEMPALHLRLTADSGRGVEPAADDAAVRAAIEQAREQGGTALTLTDGEVLARPESLDWVDLARSLGFRAIEVRSNGRAIIHPDRVQQVLDAGATHISVALNGPDATSHDYISGQPGSFAVALRALKVARRIGAVTRVVCPLLRPTYRSLPTLVKRSLALGVSGFDFVAIAGVDRPSRRLLPHLGLVAQHLQRALAVAAVAKRNKSTWRVPLCLLAEHADIALEAGQPTTVVDAVDAPNEPSYFKHEQGLPCASCAAASSCPGPLSSQVLQHGWSGLIPTNDRATARAT